MKGSAEFLRGEKEGCCHFPVGEKTQHTHLTENTEGHGPESETGWRTATKEEKNQMKQIIPNHTGGVGENKKLTDIENYFFLFALTNFLVIVFHCKRKRPAVISRKRETRKERENERRVR